MSHALRVRGLKLDSGRAVVSQVAVARSTRAWIETVKWHPAIDAATVARSTRAWIETRSCLPRCFAPVRSHALRVRGLKLIKYFANGTSAIVARSTRAWIETLTM